MKFYDANQYFSKYLLFAKTEGIIPAPETTHAIAATIREAKKAKEEGKEKGKSEFARLVAAHRTDTIVRAFVNLRRKLFVEGESVDQMTASIRKRISDLQSRGNVVH